MSTLWTEPSHTSTASKCLARDSTSGEKQKSDALVPKNILLFELLHTLVVLQNHEMSGEVTVDLREYKGQWWAS